MSLNTHKHIHISLNIYTHTYVIKHINTHMSLNIHKHIHMSLNIPYFMDYRLMGTIGRIAAFRLNFLGNTKIGRSIP